MADVRQWEMRIVDFRLEDPNQLLLSPYSAYIHPHTQQLALDLSLETLGWLLPVVVNRLTQHLLHGGMLVQRASWHGQKQVPVLYVELPEELEAAAAIMLNAISRMSLPDDDLPYSQRGNELVYISNLSPFEEVVKKITASRPGKAVVESLVKLGAIRLGKEARSRTAKRAALKLEQMADVKYQVKNHGKLLFAVPGTSVRIYGDEKEVKEFLVSHNLKVTKAA